MNHEELAQKLENAVQRILKASSKSSARQKPLADYLLSRLRDGLLPQHLHAYLKSEAKVPGLARVKSWDIGLVYPKASKNESSKERPLTKPRLLLSLKSILANPSGSWPNRLDDLVGEASSVQMLFPEVVIGYVVVLDYGARTRRKGKDKQPVQNNLESLYDRFVKGLRDLSKREPPLWAQGMIEGHWVISIDSRKSNPLLEPQATVEQGEKFLEQLIGALKQREPLLFVEKKE